MIMPTEKKHEPSRYVAVRQLIYPHKDTGEEVICNPSDEVLNMADSSMVLEIKAGNMRAVDDTEQAVEEQL